MQHTNNAPALPRPATASARRARHKRNELDNPYLLLTKGQMLENCRIGHPKDRLRQRVMLALRTSSMERQEELPQELRLLLSMHHQTSSISRIQEDRFREATGLQRYRIDVCKMPEFVHEPVTGRDLRAVLAAIGAGSQRLDPLLSGPVPASTTMQQLSNLHARGVQELREFFAQKGSHDVKSYAGIA